MPTQDKYKEVKERFNKKFYKGFFGWWIMRDGTRKPIAENSEKIMDFIYSELSAQEEKIKKDLSETIIKGIEKLYVGTGNPGEFTYHKAISDVLTYIKSL